MADRLHFWQIGPDLAVKVCGDPALTSSLDVVFGAFRIDPDEAQGRVLTLSAAQSASGVWQVVADGQPSVCARPGHSLPVLLESVLSRMVVHATTSCSIFHAAMVEVSGSGVLLPGERGAGKSTLALYLAGRGGRYFGDDLCFFRASDRAVLAFPKAVTLKEGSFAEVPEAPVFDDPLRGPVRYCIPQGAGPCQTGFDRLAALIFPEFDESATGVRVQKVKPELAAMSLVQQSCGGVGRHDHTLPLVTALVEKPAYYMTYPHSEAAESGIRDILGQESV